MLLRRAGCPAVLDGLQVRRRFVDAQLAEYADAVPVYERLLKARGVWEEAWHGYVAERSDPRGER